MLVNIETTLNKLSKSLGSSMQQYAAVDEHGIIFLISKNYTG